jgi:glucose/arabinose dehydrogenase
MILSGCAVQEAPTPMTEQPTRPDVATTSPSDTASPTPPTPEEGDSEPAAAPFDPNTTRVALEPLFDGLNQPVHITSAADGSDRLFVVEKPGRILVYAASREEPTVFLDITDRVGSTGFEQGLLGLAFPPDHAQSGHFFVNYTDRNGDTVIARFAISTSDANAADPASEFEILQIAQPAGNHNGGLLLFGPDGNLWIGTGDGGRANDAFGHGQNASTLLGAMLRLDVTSDPAQPYTIPADNPWLETTDPANEVRDEIWAIGLRNPWRYSFDRATGDLWIADVGQNQYEEVNLVNAEDLANGHNFGWPIMEGQQCFQRANCNADGLHLPIIDYDRSEGCSITGGNVYRGAAFNELQGIYFYGDYCSGTVWGYWVDAQNESHNVALMETGQSISSFGEDEAGELYITDLNGGTVSRIVVTP